MKGPRFGRRAVGAIFSVAIFFVVGAVHDPGNFAPVQCACAHKARLDGNINGGVGEVFAAEVIESGGKGDDFCVCGGVVELLYLVASACDDAVVLYDERADGYLACVECFFCFFQCCLHEMFIGHWSENTKGEKLKS